MAEVNAHVYKAFPPKLHHAAPGHPARYTYGRLYYYGQMMGITSPEDALTALWMLDGMTPVTYQCVLDMIEPIVGPIPAIRQAFAKLQESAYQAAREKTALRRTAALKLTAAERAACDLPEPMPASTP